MPGSKIFLFLLGFIPSIAWLWYFSSRDSKPEPTSKIVSFFVRGLFSAFVALLFQWFFIDFLALEAYLIYSLPVLSVFLAAFIEEIIKFVFFRKSLFKNKFFDEPVDAVIYMVTVGVGFAAVENVAIFLKSEPGQVANIFILRMITATLLHAVTAALIGYFFALSLLKKRRKFFVFLGILEAGILHSIYNLLIHFSEMNEDFRYTFLLLSSLLIMTMLLTSHLTLRLDKIKVRFKNNA